MRKIIVVLVVAILFTSSFAGFIYADDNAEESTIPIIDEIAEAEDLNVSDEIIADSEMDAAVELLEEPEEPEEPETSGNCGESLTWSYAEGTLTIAGTGEMDDYSSDTLPPWHAFAGEITEVRFGKGITSIGTQAFADCVSITDIYYDGTADEWSAIIKDEGNDPLTGAAFHSNVNGWLKIDGEWYYYVDGTAVTGWVLDGDRWYFMNDSGAMMTGWLSRGSKWYFLNPSGYMQTGWKKINEKWYYFKPSGAMATGWVLDGDRWYFMKDSGAMMTGWLSRGSKWYYLNPSGAMQTGWKKVNDKWYYFNPSGAMRTGWLQEGKAWYYLSNSGAMVTGWQKIGSKQYEFLGSGRWIDRNVAQEKAEKMLDKSGRDLKSVYNWVVANLTYVRNSHGDTTSQNALNAYNTGYADCIGFASAFCYMARALGYDCVVLYGEVPYASGGYGDHAWCEIVVNGKTYWVDTQFAKQTGRNGYLFNYGQSGTWVYRNWSELADD